MAEASKLLETFKQIRAEFGQEFVKVVGAINGLQQLKVGIILH